MNLTSSNPLISKYCGCVGNPVATGTGGTINIGTGPKSTINIGNLSNNSASANNGCCTINKLKLGYGTAFRGLIIAFRRYVGCVGNIVLYTSNSGTSGDSGALLLSTGLAPGLNSGKILISTGISNVNSGAITLSAGTAATGSGGTISLVAGDNNGAGNFAGSVVLKAGSGLSNNPNNGGYGGDLVLAAGYSAGLGSANAGGSVNINAGELSTNCFMNKCSCN
jgi:hypothetical protein